MGRGYLLGAIMQRPISGAPTTSLNEYGLAGQDLVINFFKPDNNPTYVWILSSGSAQPAGTRGRWTAGGVWGTTQLWYF